MDIIKKTADVYGFLWGRGKNIIPANEWHFNKMKEVINEPIVRGKIGIDIGSGCGYDTYIMAKNNPYVKITSIDISDGVYKTRELTSELENVWISKCSILNMPLKNNIFDFAYSFGALHHTADPKKGLLEISRILKKNSPAFLYLYESHLENFIKYIAVGIIAKLRGITVKLPPKILYALSWVLSPFVYIVFSFPAKILKKFNATKNFADKLPFNFGMGPFYLSADLYDRFSAPVERRFSRQEVYDMFIECGFFRINITKINNTAGWVAWGYKK